MQTREEVGPTNQGLLPANENAAAENDPLTEYQINKCFFTTNFVYGILEIMVAMFVWSLAMNEIHTNLRISILCYL